MSEILYRIAESAASQVPLAVVFLVAIVWIVTYAMREIGSIVDRNTIAWTETTQELRRLRKLFRVARPESKGVEEPSPR